MMLKYLILTVKSRIHNTPTYQIMFWAFAITVTIGLSIYLFNTSQYFYVYCMENQFEASPMNSSPVSLQNMQPQMVINNYEAVHPQVLSGNFFMGISVGVAVGVVVFALIWAMSVKLNCT